MPACLAARRAQMCPSGSSQCVARSARPVAQNARQNRSPGPIRPHAVFDILCAAGASAPPIPPASDVPSSPRTRAREKDNDDGPPHGSDDDVDVVRLGARGPRRHDRDRVHRRRSPGQRGRGGQPGRDRARGGAHLGIGLLRFLHRHDLLRLGAPGFGRHAHAARAGRRAEPGACRSDTLRQQRHGSLLPGSHAGNERGVSPADQGIPGPRRRVRQCRPALQPARERRAQLRAAAGRRDSRG